MIVLGEEEIFITEYNDNELVIEFKFNIKNYKDFIDLTNYQVFKNNFKPILKEYNNRPSLKDISKHGENLEIIETLMTEQCGWLCGHLGYMPPKFLTE